VSVYVAKLNGELAARVDGVEFAGGDPLPPAALQSIEAALYEHGVIVVPAVEMSAAQHLALARHFGEPERHEFFPNLGEGLEEVTLLDSERDRSNMWHRDEPFLARPPIITMTHAQRLPPYGGDTAFISLHAAYDALSDRMKSYLDGLTAVHDLAMIAEHGWRGGTGDAPSLIEMLERGKRAVHPVVRVHPATGRRAVWVCETYTRWLQGVPPLEAKSTLQFLFAHVQRPEFQYRHRWRPGDLLIWDNRSVLHYAAFDYAGERRVMHRVSVLEPAAS
jgi:taurine dioxygenase